MRVYMTILAIICALGAAFGVARAWEEDKDDRD